MTLLDCPPSAFRFCPGCGGVLNVREIHHHSRLVCRDCGRVLYRNPAVGVAVVARRGETILFGRRAGGLYRGAWCLPCGYVEWGEDIRAAAVREFREETGLIVTVEAVLAAHSNFHDPERLTVGVWFAAQVRGGQLAAGDDLDRVAFLPLTEPPEPLAFPTDRQVLAELQAGAFDRIPDSENAPRGTSAPGNHQSSARMPDRHPGE